MSMMTAMHAISLPDQEEDEFLMLRYGRGDIRAFEMLYQRHRAGLYRYFVRQIGDRTLAEDLYQETWSRVIKSAPAYEVSVSFSCWLYRVAHNLLTEHVRAVKPLNEALEWQQAQYALSDAMTPVNNHEEQRQVLALREGISLLPQVQKEAFLLSSEMGFSAQAISEIASVSLEAAKSRIRYAYQGLESCLYGHQQGDGYED